MNELPVKADVSESLNEILKQTFLPAASQIGKALKNVSGLFCTMTLPIQLFNEYGLKNFQKYVEKIKDTPDEKIKVVEPEIAIPILEKLSYTSNEDLANASIEDKIDLIHPAFVQMLQRLSHDEVRMLEYLKTKKHLPYLYFYVDCTDNSSKKISTNLIGAEQILGISEDRIAIHIENLISLSIIKDHNGFYYTDENIYSDLKSIYNTKYAIYEADMQNGKYGDCKKLKPEQSYYSITDFGRAFIEACSCPNQSNKIFMETPSYSSDNVVMGTREW